MVFFVIDKWDMIIFQGLAIHNDQICFVTSGLFVFNKNMIHRFTETIIQLVFSPVFGETGLDF